MRQVLRDRNLRVLLVGQTANIFGNSAMIIVLAIWVKDLTGSNGAAGVVFLLLALPSLCAPLLGLLVDRFSRRDILIANDVVTGALVLALLVVHDRGDIWLIYLVTLVNGFSTQIYRAARGGLLHSMVPGDLLGDVNGVFSSLNQGLRIVGPVAGAGIYTVAGGGAVAIVDAASFVVSVVCYLLLQGVPELASGLAPGHAAGQVARPAFLAELAAGVRHVATTPIIRRIVFSCSVAFAGAGMVNVALFALVDQGLHRPAAIIGVLGGVQGGGSVAAGLAVGSMMRRLGEYSTASIGFLLNGVGLVAAATATLTGAFLAAALIGLGLPMVLVAELTLVQRRTPSELQGRVIAASEAIIDIPFAAAIGLGSLIIASVGFRPIYLSVAVSFTVVGLFLLRYRTATGPVVPAPAGLGEVPVS